MFKHKMMYVITGFFLLTGSTLYSWDLDFLPWDRVKVISIKEIKKLEEKKEYKKAAEEYWKRIKISGDEDAYIELQKIPKYALETRHNNMADAAKKLAEKRGMEMKRYDGNAFILVQDEDDLIEKIFKYYSAKWYTCYLKSNDTILQECMQAAYPTRSFIGPNTGKIYNVKSFSNDGCSIPFLTLDIMKKEFPYTNFSHSNEMGIYFADKKNKQKLIPADIFNRTSYKAKIDAFINLCQHYGARYLELTRLESSEMALTISADGVMKNLGGTEIKIDGDSSMGIKYKEIFKCSYMFNGKRCKGQPPNSPWLNDDFKYFRERCESNNSIEKAEVTLEYTEDIGLSGSFIAKLSQFGVNTGYLNGKLKGGKAEKYYCTYTVYFTEKVHQADLDKNKASH